MRNNVVQIRVFGFTAGVVTWQVFYWPIVITIVVAIVPRKTGVG